MFFKTLAQMISDKRNENRAIVASWIRTKIFFALLRASLVCLRGSRYHFYQPQVPEAEIGIDLRGR